MILRKMDYGVTANDHVRNKCGLEEYFRIRTIASKFL